MSLPFIGSDDIARLLPMADAIDVLEETFRSSPSAPPRAHVDVNGGQLLLMPASSSAAVGVKTLGVCAAVSALHVLLGRLALEQGVYTEGLPFGFFRLVVDGLAYLLLVFLTRAVRLDEMLGLVRMLRDRRAQKTSHA